MEKWNYNPYEEKPSPEKKPEIDCPNCGGTGKIIKDGKQVECPRCFGRGRIYSQS